MELSALVSQILPPSLPTPEEVTAHKAKKDAPFSTDALAVLQAKCQELSGAPCSPTMSGHDLIEKIMELQALSTVEVEDKKIVKPSKPQGIGAKILELLKAGTSPKDTLKIIQETFEDCATSMACVYWYKSKINTGIM